MSLGTGYAFLSCSAFVMHEGESDDQTMLGVFDFVFTRGEYCSDRIFSISKFDDSLDFSLGSLFGSLLSLRIQAHISVLFIQHIRLCAAPAVCLTSDSTTQWASIILSSFLIRSRIGLRNRSIAMMMITAPIIGENIASIVSIRSSN